MKIIKTSIADCIVIELNHFCDFRGKFTKFFSFQLFKKKKINFKVRQINFCTFKKKNILRGFHYQKKPKEEIKIVACVRGSCKVHVLDVRKKSVTYKNFFSYHLTEKKNTMLLIPKGCANAFHSTKANSSLVYFSSNDYSPKFESKIHFKNKLIDIKFPKKIILSKKDNSITI